MMRVFLVWRRRKLEMLRGVSGVGVGVLGSAGSFFFKCRFKIG